MEAVVYFTHKSFMRPYASHHSLKFVLFVEVSYNQPKLSSWATWNPNATTFADNTTLGVGALGFFVSTDNTVYVAELSLNRVQVWTEGNSVPVRTISDGLNYSCNIFATSNGDLYIDNGKYDGRVDMWAPNSTASTVAMYVDESCYGLFVDIYESIYCSVGFRHKVLKKSVNDLANTSIMVAGNGTNGAASSLLSNPRGIFVDTQLNLYVADCDNNRIQRFVSGQSNAATVMGNGSTTTIILHCPNSVVLDADGHLYVVDYGNNRIIGWGPNGYQCIAACNASTGSTADYLNAPFALYFDSYGNIFVSDTGNSRIQKFLIMQNDSGKFQSDTELLVSAMFTLLTLQYK